MSNEKVLTTKETFDLAVKNHQKNNIKEAQNLYNKILGIDPNYVNAHNNLGVIFQGLREYQKAKECYEKAIKINPNYADAYYNLGVIFKELKEYQKAKECFEKTIKINPNYVNAHNNLGTIFIGLKEYQKAKEYYEKAIEINPNLASAHWGSHGQSSNIDEALLILKKLYKIDNKHIKAKIMIGALEGYKGNFNYFFITLFCFLIFS